jgi:hypothetical protein
VTRNPAQILKWDKVLGTVTPGKRADLIVVDGQKSNPYEHLINAPETALSLVIIDGVLRYGKEALMEPIGSVTEIISIGGTERMLNLDDPTTHPLVHSLSLTDAIERLRKAMKDLPQLAKELEARSADEAMFVGSADPQGEIWQLVPDFEEDDRVLDARIAFDGRRQKIKLKSMTLEGITVADDPNFLPNMAKAHNLPKFLKEGLPTLY